MIYTGDHIRRYDGLVHRIVATHWGYGHVKYTYIMACLNRETDVIFEEAVQSTEEPVTCMACISSTTT